MTPEQEMHAAGISAKLSRKIADELRREAPRSKAWARQETLYRPQNRLADMAIRMGCPRDVAMSVALSYV